MASDLNEGPARTLAKELDGTFVPSDVTDPESVRSLIRASLDAHGRVDVMVNNAGIARNVPSEEATDDDWRRLVSVNIASMSGMVSNYHQPQAAYNAAKAGIIVLTKSLAGDRDQRGVRVNAISPGYTRTNMTAGGMANEEWYRVWLGKTPMGRVADGGYTSW